MMEETIETQALLTLRGRIEELERELQECRLRIVREKIASQQAKLAADKLKSQLWRATGAQPEETPMVEEAPTETAALFATLLAQADDLKAHLARASVAAEKSAARTNPNVSRQG